MSVSACDCHMMACRLGECSFTMHRALAVSGTVGRFFAGYKFREFRNFESNSRKIRSRNLASHKIRGVASGAHVEAQWRY